MKQEREEEGEREKQERYRNTHCDGFSSLGVLPEEDDINLSRLRIVLHSEINYFNFSCGE